MNATDGVNWALTTLVVTPNWTLSPAYSVVGNLISGNGTGFPANTTITFSLAGVDLNSTGQGVNATCSTDASGIFPGATGTPCDFVLPAVPGGLEQVVLTPGRSFAGPDVGAYAYGAAYDSGKGEVFVANAGSDNVSVISDTNDEVVATVPVAGAALELAYDSGRGEIFVTLSGSTDVSVISDSNDTMIANIPVGDSPTGIAYDSGRGEIFVSNLDSNNVTVISDSNNTVVANIRVGDSPRSIVYDSGRGEVFVGNECSNRCRSPVGTVSVISDSTNRVLTNITTGDLLFYLTYDPNKGEIFAMDDGINGPQYPADISVISDTNNSIAAVTYTPYVPNVAAFVPQLGEVFGGTWGANNVTVISDVTYTAVGAVKVGTKPYGIAYDSGRDEMFVVNGLSDNVSIIPLGNSTTGAIRVSPNLGLVDYPGSADVGQTIQFEGTGFGSSLNVSRFELGMHPLQCTSATIGTCTNGVLKTARSGQVSARFVVPAVSPPGVYNLTVTDSSGESASTQVDVFGALVVAIPTASPGSIDLGQSANFNVTATFGAEPYTYAWIGLPENCTGLGSSLSCTPTAIGNYSISVRIGDSSGLSIESGNLSFVVFADPIAGRPSANPESGNVDAGESVTFSAVASLGTTVYASYDWTGLPIGCNGILSSVACPGSEVIQGTYYITVTVTDSNNVTSLESPSLAFLVTSGPTVTELYPSRSDGDVGQSVTFFSSSSGGSGGDSYAWEGLPTGCTSGSTPISTCIPSAAGTFHVSIVISDSNGGTATSSALTYVVFSDPTVQLSSNRTSLDVDQILALSATATLGSGGFTYLWSGLPPGCGGSRPVLTCSPTEPGTFSVEIVATDSNGDTTLSSKAMIVVAPALLVAISMSESRSAPGQVVEFSANVTGGTGPWTYSWEFGDGARGAGSSVTHAYSSSGVYSGSVWVNDSAGASVKGTFSLTVSGSSSTEGLPPTSLWFLVGAAVGAAIGAVAVLLLVQRRRNRDGESSGADQAVPIGLLDEELGKLELENDPRPEAEDRTYR